MEEDDDDAAADDDVDDDGDDDGEIFCPFYDLITDFHSNCK
jgi:hypothetical protein